MHYLQKQLLEEEKKRAKLNAGHCKTEGKKKTKLNAGHCKSEEKEETVEEVEVTTDVKKIAGELDGAVKMHSSQAKRLRDAGIPDDESLPKEVRDIAKELDGAVKMHKTQADRLRKAGIKEGYRLNEQKGQKFNFARARKVFEKHWREMERKVVNELVQPYEGRGPVNYDLKAERQVSDYFETNTEDLLDYITERFEDLN